MKTLEVIRKGEEEFEKAVRESYDYLTTHVETAYKAHLMATLQALIEEEKDVLRKMIGSELSDKNKAYIKAKQETINRHKKLIAELKK